MNAEMKTYRQLSLRISQIFSFCHLFNLTPRSQNNAEGSVHILPREGPGRGSSHAAGVRRPGVRRRQDQP
jgi:hypothetical protein